MQEKNKEEKCWFLRQRLGFLVFSLAQICWRNKISLSKQLSYKMLHNIKLLRFDCEIMPAHKNLANMSKNIHFINDTKTQKKIFHLSVITNWITFSIIIVVGFSCIHFYTFFFFAYVFIFCLFLFIFCFLLFLSIFDLWFGWSTVIPFKQERWLFCHRKMMI